ncbi:MAG: acyl-CoA dehydrogenase family protein [Actinomycetota bacterium]
MPLSTEERQAIAGLAWEIAQKLRPSASDLDAQRAYPDEHLAALADAGLTGLLVSEAHGGKGGDLTALALVTEAIGWAGGSTGLCFLMHLCGTAVIGAKATPAQGKEWLEPAARGELLATLAFSERATGAHFYMPEITAQKSQDGFTLTGTKSFVTSGGHAYLYPVLVNASGEAGLDVLVLTADDKGVSFEGTWEGIGMTGNSSIQMVLDTVEISADRLIGAEGAGQELVFNVVAPNFLIGLAGVNLGIAQAALDDTIDHVKTRRNAGGMLAELPTVQTQIAQMTLVTEQARALLLAAARAADAGDQAALPLVMQAKIAATEAAIEVTGAAMEACGGLAYSKRLPIERYWRDSRAGSVMAPTNEVLKQWVGKLATGLPLF